MSGTCQYVLGKEGERDYSCPRHWPGLVIELEIPVNSYELVSDNDIEGLGFLAEELAI